MTDIVALAELSLATGGMLMNFFILPTVLNDNAAVPRKQSLPTASILFLFFTVPYLYLGFVWPAISTLVGSVLWGYVALYRTLPRHSGQTSL